MNNNQPPPNWGNNPYGQPVPPPHGTPPPHPGPYHAPYGQHQQPHPQHGLYGPPPPQHPPNMYHHPAPVQQQGSGKRIALVASLGCGGMILATIIVALLGSWMFGSGQEGLIAAEQESGALSKGHAISGIITSFMLVAVPIYLIVVGSRNRRK